MSGVVWQDLAGQMIEVGSIIVYAALWSRSAVMKYGVVTRLETREDEYSWRAYGSSKTLIPTLRVKSVDRSGDAWKEQNKGREITLGFTDRVLVVTPDQLPDDVWEIFVPWLHQISEEKSK